jgi:hypothetical protein
MPTAALLETAELPLDYKICGCRTMLPGRGCAHCFSSHWLKRCKDCYGLGTLEKAARQTNSSPRVERCGRCSGTGWVPCPLREVPLAEARQEAEEEEIQGIGTGEPAAAAAEDYAQLAVPIRRRGRPAGKTKPKLKPKQTRRRPQNPLEALAMERPEDTPESAKAAAAEARMRTREDLKGKEEEDQPQQDTLAAFSPDDLPPAA